MLGEVQKPGVYPCWVRGACLMCCRWPAAPLQGGEAGQHYASRHPADADHVSLSNDAAESVHSNVDIFPGDTDRGLQGGHGVRRRRRQQAERRGDGQRQT